VAGSRGRLRRRDLLTALCAASGAGRMLGVPRAAAVVMRVADRKILFLEGAEAARRRVVSPGSTLKPFALLALLEAGKLNPSEALACSRNLTILGRSLPCSHPAVPIPMNASRALAYSCNVTVAHFAQRFSSGELSAALLRSGFGSLTGLIIGSEAPGEVSRSAAGPTAQLQALGEWGVRVTPLELLLAYCRLARRAAEPALAPVLDGLEGAVEFGTAQAARLPNCQVAGKTGSVITAAGEHVAWFAGFAPSRKPRIAVVVLVDGHSGGADAAPLAGALLSAHLVQTS
jgi:cell division protein FtsI (penicillin-binding protein 3)